MHPELVPYGTTIPEVLSHKDEDDAEAWQLLANIDAILMYKEEASGVESLSPLERQVRAIQGMIREVNNGGFDQFFYNSSGQFAYDLLPALECIGSSEFLAIARDALLAFGSPDKLDDETRQSHLETITQDGDLEPWEECDNHFYECAEQLEAMCLEYLASQLDKAWTSQRKI